MSDDIVTRLREKEWPVNYALEAANEIKRLRKALAIAVGELSTYPPYSGLSPEWLMNGFMDRMVPRD